MSIQETATFTVDIVLSTHVGELPLDHEVERMVYDQLTGELDDMTGLHMITVQLIKREA